MPFGAAVNAAASVAEDVALTESNDAPDVKLESLKRLLGAVVDTDVVSRTLCCHQLLKLVVLCLGPYSTSRRSYVGAVATEHKASVMELQSERPMVGCARMDTQRLRCPYAVMPTQ